MPVTCLLTVGAREAAPVQRRRAHSRGAQALVAVGALLGGRRARGRAHWGRICDLLPGAADWKSSDQYVSRAAGTACIPRSSHQGRLIGKGNTTAQVTSVLMVAVSGHPYLDARWHIV
eukprot:6194304-Pleurochrysis_carterae.AAC.2